MAAAEPQPDVVRALVLFAGKDRQTFFGEELRKLCRDRHAKFLIDEIDILRGGDQHGLQNTRMQEALLKKVRQGLYDIVVASPPGGALSRARHSANPGPMPVRSASHPRGFPNLSGRVLKEVQTANELIDFTCVILLAQATRGGCWLLGHPEDLGRTRRGTVPGSIWQWASIQHLSTTPSCTQGALYQLDWGRYFLKPTRLMGRVDELVEILYEGPPTWDADGTYLGPLPSIPDVMTKPLAGKINGEFATAAAAPWPPLLCKHLAKLTFLHVTEYTPGKALSFGRKGVSLEGVAVSKGIPDSTDARHVQQGEEKAFPDGCRVCPNPRPKRLQVTEAQLKEMGGKKTYILEDGIYIGRGGRHGVPRSKWANPYKVGVHGSIADVIRLFGQHLAGSDFVLDLDELEGRNLLCHCPVGSPCHGDVLLQSLVDVPEVVEENKELIDADVKNCPLQTTEVTGLAQFVDDGLAAEEVRRAWDELVAQPVVGGGCSGSRGWRGSGPPRTVSGMGPYRKPFADGGGLCSPGRWAPSKRRSPSSLADAIWKVTEKLFRQAVDQRSGGADDCLGFMLKLAAGKFQTLPFDEALLQKLRQDIALILGISEEAAEPHEKQVIRFGLIGELLRAMEDPDWKFVSSLRFGTPLGVDEDLPRTPEVFEQKLKWSLGEPGDEATTETGNYSSLEPYVVQVEALFREEAAEGWMVVLTDEEAKAEYGDKLHLAALAVISEADKFRVLHDGSNGIQINHRIKVQDQLRCPGPGEIRQILHEKAESGSRAFSILGDFSKAHRRVPIARKDWGYQGCRLRPGSVWLNCVGTYGMAPAAYHWGRFGGAAVVRLGHYLVKMQAGLELLLFADDFIGIVSRLRDIIGLGGLIFLWAALGLPFKWPKFRGGQDVGWIGFRIDLWNLSLGISQSRAAWLCAWMRGKIAEGMVEMADFHGVLGRLCFVLGALRFIRAFVAPLFAWGSAVGYSGRRAIPWSVRFIWFS